MKPNEAIVIENAPLGVEAGHKAGIFTIAVNTGPLNGEILLNAGADLLFPSMQSLCESWERISPAPTLVANKTKMADNCLIISHFFLLPEGESNPILGTGNLHSIR